MARLRLIGFCTTEAAEAFAIGVHYVNDSAVDIQEVGDDYVLLDDYDDIGEDRVVHYLEL